MDPVAEETPADWVKERLTTFSESVASLVPDVFDDYARILHPAGLGEGPSGRPVRWEDIAHANGIDVHDGVRFVDIVPPGCFDEARLNWRTGQAGLWQWPPEQGDLPLDVADALVATLRPRTDAPESCYFAFWDGWGDPAPFWPPTEDDDELRNRQLVLDRYRSGEAFEGTPRGGRDQAARFSIPGRDYYLFQGRIEEAMTEWDGHSGNLPSMWWPEDRAWFVHTEIDFDSTYVGASRDCIDALLAHPALETMRCQPA